MVAADEESGLRRQELRFVKGMFVRIEAQCEQRRPCTAANAQLRLDCIGRESLTIFREPARQPHTGDKAMDGSDRDRNDADVTGIIAGGIASIHRRDGFVCRSASCERARTAGTRSCVALRIPTRQDQMPDSSLENSLARAQFPSRMYSTACGIHGIVVNFFATPSSYTG